MNIETRRESSILLRLALMVSMVCSAVSAYLVLQINGIVHGQLYDYSLQFSLLWASPYWDLERMIYACSAVPIVTSGLALAYSFLMGRKKAAPKVERAVTKTVAAPAPVTATPVDSSMVITCPKCRKVFTRPLNMLDFSKGRAQLVNVCPYCNYILGSASEKDSDGTRVILPDKTEIEQK